MKRPSMLFASAILLMLAFVPATVAQSAADEAATPLLCVDSKEPAQALGDPILGPIEAATYPVCSHAICYEGSPVGTCRCPSGSCRAGQLAWCDEMWHPTCYCY